MSFRRIGFCGVDESVDPDLLSMVASRFPRVEFGILFRDDKTGTPRYPSEWWVANLVQVTAAAPMSLAAHLCGQKCTDLLEKGDASWLKDNIVVNGFRRIQINATKVNGVNISDMGAAASRLRSVVGNFPDVEWIIQANEETKKLWEPFAKDATPVENVSLLFDASCGTGKALENFPSPPANGIKVGYAGGVGPANITQVLKGVRAAVKPHQAVWVDMESKLRSQADGQDIFDIGKVMRVCRAVDEEGWEDPRPKPEVSIPSSPSNARVSTHPLLAHKLTLLRDHSTPPRLFRSILREVTFHVGYEATAALKVAPRSDVITPVGPVDGNKAVRLCETIALIPILRAGLGMVEAMQELLPNAVVHHIGMFRAHGGGSRPIEYYSRLPNEATDIAFVLEPMIATSQTIHAAITKLKGWGAKRIAVLTIVASRKGLTELQKNHPDVTVYTAAMDESLNARGFIVPGLGDAGDRQFGTPAGDPTSKDVYGSVFTKDGKLSSVLSPRMRPVTPGERAAKAPRLSIGTSPEHRPVTRVLGNSAEEAANDIPEVVLLDLSATQLTTHDGSYGVSPIKMDWGAKTPAQRGPVLATIRHPSQRNAIGAHSGGYSIYRALAVVSQALDETYFPKLGMTTPVARIGPFDAWGNRKRIVTIDPYGHAISEAFGPWLEKGYDIRPTIAVTKAHIELPECKDAIRVGRLKPDGLVLSPEGQSFVTKAAIEPVWYLPGVAERFGVDEGKLRDALFRETNSMYPELLTRNDLKLFLPPIGGMTVYIWGDPEKIPDESVELTVRVHDECNGSDVFGSDICTCRPYLTHAIEECIKTAQRGGTGVVVYFRKEGRALGEVTKYLVYNMRKRQEGGDKASEYFNCTKEVAGVTDTRFQVLMPDVLHWLGITKIHRFISMSDMKHDAIVSTGIKIVERVEIPPEMVPKDAQVEITAKVFAGYHSGKSYVAATDAKQLDEVKGREYSKELLYDKSVTEGGNSYGTADGAKK